MLQTVQVVGSEAVFYSATGASAVGTCAAADDSRMQVLYSPNSSLLSEEFEDASSSDSEGVTGPGLDNANCLP